MMPPMSGMQAMAAATFEGKPVEVDFVFASGCGLGGGGGWLGSIGSGMPIVTQKTACCCQVISMRTQAFYDAIKV